MKETTITIRMHNSQPKEAILLTMDFREENNMWLAECLELGTATYAATLDQARKEIEAFIILQLNEIEKLGFVEDFLEEHRVRLIPLQPPKRTSSGSTWVAPPVAVG